MFKSETSTDGWEMQEETPTTNSVTITEENFLALQRDSVFLEALEQTGVDNWNGYCDAVELLDSWGEGYE